MMHESYSSRSFSWMQPMPTNEETTQYRLGELERSFRDFKMEWGRDLDKLQLVISNTQTTTNAGLSAIQSQLAAMAVRDEQWKSLDGRLTNIEKLSPDSINGRVKQLEDRSWQIVLAIITAAGALVWTAVETIPKVKLP